ncbi:WD repeat-containing protein 63-like isoform X2 [Stegodyphus dumicola]|uniref:WD repeat-containing protein 63-like isoform X2 n=1 Tax=Stegodyphus dumicola TaxID=202533 RepID=UPI0015AC872A|nr:WD repeat-containing protein 63-like isoform X2 [Stegodyphus dumicola]
MKKKFIVLTLHDDATRFYIWSAKNQFCYKLLLEYLDDIFIFKFNSVMPNLIAGGSITGQLILWDLQNVKIASNEMEIKDDCFQPVIARYTAASSMDYCHLHGLTHLMWIPNHIEILAKGDCKQNEFNHSYQIATCGLDGVLRFWDLRAAIAHKPGQTVPKYFHNLDGKWEPFHSVDIMSSDGKRQSVTCFTLREVSKLNKKEVSQDDDPGNTSMDTSAKKPLSTEFICGCDDGKLLRGNFKLEKDETGKYITKLPELFSSPHSSSVTTLAASPFVEDVFLSGGSRTFAIRKHGILNPVLLREMHTYITSGEWSPTKPSVFIVGYDDGSIEVWNLLSNIYEPYLVYFVSTSAVNSISFQTLSENEQIVAIGDAKGVVYKLTVPHYLWKPTYNELELTIQYINEESDRIQKFSYEAKMPTEKPEETFIQQIEKAKPPEDIPREITEEELLLKNYAEFQELEKIQLQYLGLIEDDNEENEDEVSHKC